MAFGELDDRGLDAPLLLEPVTLQLDVEPAREDRRQALERGLGGIALALGQEPVERPRRPAGPPVSAMRPSEWAARSSTETWGVSPPELSRKALLVSFRRLR